MKFKIVADSSADTLSLSRVPFESVPLRIITDEKEYVDNQDLNVSEMLADMKKYKGRSHTSCPNSEDYIAAFGDAENVFCITITSGLSGSFNAAMNAKRAYLEEHPDRKVHLIDSLSTGPELGLIIEKLEELILLHDDFDRIVTEIEKYRSRGRLIFALESLHNLAANGRVKPIVAKISGILGIRVVGRASDVGTLEITNKSRGLQNAVSDIVKNMISEGYNGGPVRINHAENPSAAKLIAEKLKSKFPIADIKIALTRGLCSFYAEAGGVLVGFLV